MTVRRLFEQEDLESGSNDGGDYDLDHIHNHDQSVEFSSGTLSVIGTNIIDSSDNNSATCSSSNNYSSSILKNRGKKNQIPRRKSNVSGTSGIYSRHSNGTHSTGSSSGTGNKYHSAHLKATPRPIFWGRWLFFILLLMVAAALGYMTYNMLSDNETTLAECLFEKVADNAIIIIRNNQDRKMLGMSTMGSAIGAAGYNRDQWPFVTLDDYQSLARNVIDVSHGCNIGFAPFVTPAQVSTYNIFAGNHYQYSRIPEPFPEGTAAIDDHGTVGIWSSKPFLDLTGETTSWNSSRRILAPMIQHSNGISKKLMFNLHSSEAVGKMMEDMMDCAEETKELIRKYEQLEEEIRIKNENEIDSNSNTLEEVEDTAPAVVLLPKNKPSLQDCTMVSDIKLNKTSAQQQEPNGPGASMLQPVFPASNKTEITGMLITSIVWSENMKGVFSANVDGIFVVLSTPTQSVTYFVEKGVVQYLGEGDFHDRQFDHVKKEGIITTVGMFSNTSVPYTMTLYPSERLYEMYSTHNPRIATIGAVCIMVFTLLMFLAFDCLVRREFSAKQELLKAKRHFMRYVSHEVRTPLNSVCMGLNLIQEEIQSKLNVPKAMAGGGSSSSPNGSDSAMITIDEAQAWLSLSRDVHVSAESATNVLNDFLNYDKIESRQLKLELSVIPILTLITGTTSEFVLPAQDKEIELTIMQERVSASDVTATTTSKNSHTTNHHHHKHQRWPKKIVNGVADIESQHLQDQVVVGDKARLSQVVRNVISNAIKFTPKKGSITVKSTWVVAAVGESTVINLQDGAKESLCQTGWIQIEVIDTGNGMTNEQVEKVFQSGVQFNANKNQKGGGSGLGLFIAKGIVDQHNGTLTAYSKGIGKGTSFVCKLPVYCKPKEREINNAPVASRDVSITERVSSSWLDEVSGRDLSYRILVVDDAPMNRKLLTRLLMKRGHHVEMAEDGLEAYEKVASAMKEGKRYDTILMDFQMPVMDGPTSTQKIREEGCDSFILGITGNVLPEDVAHFKNSGADGVLGKPFQVEELESLWIEYGVTL